MIPIRNIYYMLSYAFQVLTEQGFKKIETEEFSNVAELCSAILAKGVSLQLKRGLGREYIENTESLEQLLTDTVGDYLKNGFSVHRTGKSAAVRIMVPVLDFHKSFESQLNSIKTGFDAIQKMSDVAKLFPYSAVAELLRKS